MKVRSSWKAALAAVGVLVAGLASGTAGATAAAPGDGAPVFWRVPVTADPVAGLARAGFDVAESDREAAYVVGDQAVARKLRTLGYRPAYFDTVYKDVPAVSARAAADTFYGGYRTVAAQEAHLTQVASAHPDLATVYTLGPSWKKAKGQGGHDLKAICLSKKQAGDCTLSTTSAKPKFVLMAQI